MKFEFTSLVKYTNSPLNFMNNFLKDRYTNLPHQATNLLHNFDNLLHNSRINAEF